MRKRVYDPDTRHPGRHFYRHDSPMHIDLYTSGGIWPEAHRIPRSDAPLPLPFLSSDPSRLSIPPPSFSLHEACCLTPLPSHEISDRRISPPFTLRSSIHCPHTIHPSVGSFHSRYAPYYSTRECQLTWIVHHLPSPLPDPLSPRVPHGRQTVYAVRGGSVTTGWRICSDEREEKRAHTLYGRPSTTT